uniref:Uncharacterized protein n=1 Tax=Peronospora matthiolae TaxID=2874970 RepID=A0AAV1UKY6_9STRA
MAANFVRRDIYVIERRDGNDSEWSCWRYRPATINRHGRVVETEIAHPLPLLTCIDDIQAAKIDRPRLPTLILRVIERHYYACIHTEHESCALDCTDGPVPFGSEAAPGGLSFGSTPDPSLHLSSHGQHQSMVYRTSATSPTVDFPTTLVVHSPSTGASERQVTEASSLALIPERSLVVAHKGHITQGIARKRAHSPKSGSAAAATDVSIDTPADGTTKRDRVSAGPNPPLLLPLDVRIDQDEWPVV